VAEALAQVPRDGHATHIELPGGGRARFRHGPPRHRDGETRDGEWTAQRHDAQGPRGDPRGPPERSQVSRTQSRTFGRPERLGR